MLRLIAALLASILAIPAGAQTPQWQFQSSDDGSFFTGSISPSDEPGLMLLCGGRSPQGLSPTQTGNVEPDVTPRDTLRLYLSDLQIGHPDGKARFRQDVLLVVDVTGYRLPPVGWNELFSTWEVDLPATDPALSVISGQRDFEIRSAAGERLVTAQGFAPAYRKLIAHCQSMFTAIGQPWQTVAAAPARQVTMREIAKAAIVTGCGGPATEASGAILSGEIDGDGMEDILVSWGEITCSGGYPRPFCGASMCTAQLFLSSRHARGEAPEQMLAQSVWLQPLSNGNMGIVTVGSLASCQGRPTCEFLWYWNGSDIVELK